MTSHATNGKGGMLVTRRELSMPKWVAEQSNRIGPKPPPPPITPENVQFSPEKPEQPNLPPKTKQPEPDYEIIEFSNQQYSNAPLRPNSASSGSKTPDNKLKCTLCGSGNPWVTCEACAQQIFCASCDDMFHKHPKRKSHQRKTIEKSRPPLPPKMLPGQTGPSPPVAPPRRNKRGFMTPILQRKDQGNGMTREFPESTSPSPSMKSASWQERLGSLPRGMNLLNRPLPETPKTPSETSRSTTPKSLFDNIQRPPSVTLEKIKSKANATLDRMQLLQQRYRQQKEQMDRERGGSLTDQNMSAFDQWSSISQSPSHFRSGSMSSGMNSSHLDLMDDTNFNLFHQRQMDLQHHQLAMQRTNHLGQRGMSNSVLNLNRKQPIANNGWLNNSLQQAQSMAQLNCGNCSQHQLQWNGINEHQHMHKNPDLWSHQLLSQQHLNRSNMSLNMPAGYMIQQPMNNMYPPPAFMNQRNLLPQMYPQPFMGGMPVMNPGLMRMPPSTSRASVSRAGSRMASPAMSRKSVTLRRKQRSNYVDDEATDDEDSDEDDRRSITSIRSGVSRSRQRLASSGSLFQTDEDIESPHVKVHRNRGRNQRRDSVAKSVHNDWAPGRRTSSTNNNRSADSGFNSPLKTSRIYSDLDSEGSGTRALVQAKIEQKLKEEFLKQKGLKSKRQSTSPPPQKACAAVQTPSVKQTNKQEKLKKATAEPVEPVERSSENGFEDNNEVTVQLKRETAEPIEKQFNDTEAEEQEDESANEQTGETEHLEENVIKDDDLGPPPSTPDHEWECEFCTFVNVANIKICTICCKTPSVKPKEAKNSNPSPLKQIQASSQNKNAKHKGGTNNENPSTSSLKMSAHQTVTNNTASATVTKALHASKPNSVHNAYDPNESTTSMLKAKESLEDIWAAFDENIQATAHEITTKAQSQPKSARNSSTKSTSVELLENDSITSQAREIGTSPPPQTISTQTYDTLPRQKTETRDQAVAKPKQEPMHEYNDPIQHTNFPLSPKIQNLKSFEAEVLNKIHSISHVPFHYHNHNANHHIYSPNDRQRYRSNNDLRLDDTMSVDFDAFNGLGKRQPSIGELLLLQKTSPQILSPFGGSTYDLPYRDFSSLKSIDTENHKESDVYKYTTEELNAALKYCGPDMHPLVWLRDNWPKLIQTVQSLATKYGQERAENTIGTISQLEAREALRLHTGNIWQSVSECIEQRQRKYKEISTKGNFSREDIVTALTMQQGNLDQALLDLGRTQLKPFLMRIWGSPGGVENECGSQPALMTTKNSPAVYNMNKDIHNFLSANASECMQIPNATGAHQLNNNQMPSPFDRPASLNSPFESHNSLLDKTSNYSTDTDSSALRLEESIIGNKNVLKDLEILIGNMEQNQQKQNEQVLQSIQEMISNVNSKTENEYDSESMRILTKSPIISPKLKIASKDSDSQNEADVKNFVWQHIQEIVPDLVQQVEMELVGGIEDDSKHNSSVEEIIETEVDLKPIVTAPPPPPIDQDEFLMEEVIKPNIKNASIREELGPQYFYAAEIATFQLVFDKGLEREHDDQFDYETLEEAPRLVYKMYKTPEVENLPQDSYRHQQISKAADNMDDNFEEIEVKKAETQFGSLLNDLVSTKDKDLHSNPSQTSPLQPLLSSNRENLDQPSIQVRDSANTSYDLLPCDIQTLPHNVASKGDVIAFETKSEILTKSQIPINNFQQTSKIPDANEKTSSQQQNLSENTITVVDNNGTNTTQPNLSTQFENRTTVDQKQKANKELEIQTNESKERTTLENACKDLEPNEIINQDLPNPNYFADSANMGISVIAASDLFSKAIDSSLLASDSIVNKRISKIPIRRTASNKSLINFSTFANKIDSNGGGKSEAQNLIESTTDAEIAPSLSTTTDNVPGMQVLCRVKSTNEIAITADHFHDPSDSSEMFLMIEHDVSENTNASTVAPSTSSSTLHSTISQASGFKSPAEFIPSGDPSKQNLTELVEDTQRLIKQMKDEISIDDFESSTDEGEYSDEFSDDYGDREEEEDEIWEEEEDEEYDDITEGLTEENGVLSIEEDSISKTQSPLLDQESQDHRTIHNNSALSNITESSSHSLALLYDHHEHEDPEIVTNENQNISADETASFVETENNVPELPVEILLDNNLVNSQSSMQYVESENTLPEMPTEILFSQPKMPEDKIPTTQKDSFTPTQSAIANSLTDQLLVSLPTRVSNGITNMVAEFSEEPINQSQRAPEPVPPSQQTSQNEPTKSQHDFPPATIANKVSSDSQQTQLDESSISRIAASKANDDNMLVHKPSTGEATKSSQTKKKATASKIPKPKETIKESKPKSITKETKQKEVVTTQAKNDPKKKYTRSKSFSGSSTPIGIASVKTISQKFITPTPNTQLITPKIYSTTARKASVMETINKFTKPTISSEKPAAGSLFKCRTQPRIPKKKYHETCFSDDDYESSSEQEEVEPLEVRQRKLSVPIFKTYPSIRQPEELDTNELVEKFMKEKLSANVGEAQIAAALVSMKFPQDVSLWAAKECSDLDHAIALLKQECELCSGTYALNQIVTMLKCTHKCCKQCAKTYFTVQITERSINDCSCPFCKLPALHNPTEPEDENLEYFSNLDIFLKNILEPEVHELFQRKLRDRTLLKDPNFKWCVQCSSGFFARPKQRRLICPDCGSVTCAQCRKTWQKQHEGISCDQFSEWALANDPEIQAKGVQQHLEQNGIDCPKCKFKYSLARGGCMHFTCTQCKYEFCYGCAKPFMMGAKCTVSPYCAKLGLHAHHPRNCLFYLRDKLPVQLQILLKNNNVSFEVDPIRYADSDDDNEPSSSMKKEVLCLIPIQKETPTGLVDTRCNGDVPEKHAGMCRNHYVEYLTAKVAKAKIDPLPIFDLTDCVQELRRRGIPLPERGPWDTDEIYKNMCAEVIQKNIPLNID